MEGMNPNAPPPKATDVRITSWEYTDPVGVPHPDVVDVVATIANGGPTPASDLAVVVGGEWKTGPLDAPARARWEGSVPLKTVRLSAIAAGASEVVRVPVDLKARMDALGGDGRWPHALRVSVIVRGPGAATALATARAELPIKPGD
jgi:hypothetical protein